MVDVAKILNSYIYDLFNLYDNIKDLQYIKINNIKKFINNRSDLKNNFEKYYNQKTKRIVTKFYFVDGCKSLTINIKEI